MGYAGPLRRNPLFWPYFALICVYVFWGTTYLGIRMALETFPPLTLMAVRFMLSGSIMLIGAKLLGVELPRGRELRMTALYGIMMLGGGNGCLVFAEMWIPSGLAALFITTSPFWMVGLEHLMPGGEKLHAPTLIGIGIGFAGVLVLVAPAAFGAPVGPGMIRGFLVLQLGCILWVTASLLQRRFPNKAHPVVGGAVHQFATGLFYSLIAPFEGRSADWSLRGMLPVFYLVVFGSIIGFSAYVFALEKLPVAIVSTYNYVNPIVAVFLGWLFYREPFGLREAMAMVMIFVGVAAVKYYSRGPTRTIVLERTK